MPLHFKNDTGKAIWLAIAFYDERCVGSKWRKEGWWKIEPRSRKTPYTGPTNNQRFYYFAYHEDNTWDWPDIKTIHTYLPSEAFSRCWDESGGEYHGLGEFIATADDYTMTLYR